MSWTDWLQYFGLQLKKYVIASITDECSVLTKLHTLLPTIKQLCIAHSVHLAVLDALYKRNVLLRSTELCEDEDDDGEEE